MILRAKHLVLLEAIPFVGMMVLWWVSTGISKWYFYGIGMFAAFAIYLIIRANPDPNNVILGKRVSETKRE